MGNTVHCVDIDEKLVQNVVEDLKGKGHQAYSYTCDLTKHEEVQKLYDDIAGAGFVINILINNAGVAFSGVPVHEMTLTQIEHSMTVNSVAGLQKTYKMSFNNRKFFYSSDFATTLQEQRKLDLQEINFNVNIIFSLKLFVI